MPTITQTLALEDRVSPVLDRIIDRMDKLMSVMGALDSSSEKVLDPGTFSRSSSAIDRTTSSVDRLQSSIVGAGDRGASSLGEIASSAEEAHSQIQGTITETSNLSNGLAALGHGAQVFQTITDLASRAKGMLGSLGLDFTNFDRMMKRQDAASNFERTVTRITGDSQRAQEVTQDTLEIVRGTAYGLDNATTAVQQFANAGLDIDKATKRVEIWGDAVAAMGPGTNESFDRVMLNLSQMTTAQKASGADIMSILQQGIPVYQIYADAVGRSVNDIKEDLSSGTISFEDFMTTMDTALTDGTAKFASVTGAAKDASDNWENIFGNMGTAVARGQEVLLAGIDSMIEELLGEGESIKTVLMDLSSNTEAALKGVGGFVQEHGPGIVKFFTGAAEALMAVDKHTGALRILAVGAGGLIVLSGINKLVAFFSTSIAAVGKSVTGTITPLKAGATAVMRYGTAVKMASREAKMMYMGQSGIGRQMAGVKAGFDAGTSAATKFGTALRGIMKAAVWMVAIEAAFKIGESIYNHYAEKAEATERRVTTANERMSSFSSQISGSVSSSMESALANANQIADTKAPLGEYTGAIGFAAFTQGTYTDAITKTNHELEKTKELLSDTSTVDNLMKDLADPTGEFATSGMLRLFAKSGINIAEEVNKGYQNTIDKSLPGPDISGMTKKINDTIAQELKMPDSWMTFAGSGPGLDLWRKDETAAMQRWQDDVVADMKSGPSFIEKLLPAEDQAILNDWRNQLISLSEDTGLTALGKNQGMDMILKNMSDHLQTAASESNVAAQAMSLFGSQAEATEASLQVSADLAATGLAPGAQEAADGLSESADAAGDMAVNLEEALKALEGIQGLNDPFIALQKARADWEALGRESKDDIFGEGDKRAKGAMTTKSGNVNLKTESGEILNKALTDRTNAAETIIQGMIKADKSTAEIQAKAQSMKTEFDKFGDEMGVSQKQLDQYLNLDGLVPPIIDIPINADTTEADARVQGLQDGITALGFDPVNFMLSADGTAAYSEVDQITARIDEGGNMIITGDTSKAIQEADGAVTKINGMEGKLKVITDKGKLNTEVSVVEAAINKATRDRTVTITINEREGAKVKKAAGGPITGPGGPKDDKIPVMASDGEWMNKASTVRKAGGFAGMRKLTRMIDSGVLKLANGGPITDKVYSSKTLKSGSNPKQYLDEKTRRSYTRQYQQKISVPVKIGTVQKEADVKKILKQIEQSVKEAAQSSV